MLRHVDPGGRIYGAVGASNANVVAHWTTATGSAAFAVSAGNGRLGGACLRITTSSGSHTFTLSKTLDAQATWGVAFALKMSQLSVTAGVGILAQLLDAGTLQCDLRVNQDGTLAVTRNGTVLGTTATAAMAVGAYSHIEWKVTIHPSAGTVGLWVNGSQKLNLTGLNTRATANSTANAVTLGLSTNGGGLNACNLDYDDIVIYDGQATDANGLADITGPIGDCGVYWLAPTGAGSSTQFTPDSGANYARVNEATVDGDTSYVEDATVGQVDLYALADLPAGVGTVKSAALVHYARKTDTAARQLGASLRSGGTTYTHATGIDLGNTYGYSLRNWGADPATSATWTASGINALEIGEKVNS